MVDEELILMVNLIEKLNPELDAGKKKEISQDWEKLAHFYALEFVKLFELVIFNSSSNGGRGTACER